MNPILLATHNAGKLQEFQQMLAELALPIVSHADWHVPDIEETGLTFVENAIIKARHTAQYTGLSAIADDSGIEVDALNGAPGIYSARYAGIDTSAAFKNQTLLDALKEVPIPLRTARFQCVLVFLAHANDPTPLICQGTWEGRILLEPQGTGFGYDPIFYVPTHDCSAATLSTTEKNRLSHRGQALQALLKKLPQKLQNHATLSTTS